MKQEEKGMMDLGVLVCNVHGIRQHRGQEDRMIEVVEEARRQKRQIVVLTETHFDVADSIRFYEIAEQKGYTSYSVTRTMKRFDSGSGGVTILVDVKIRAKEVRKSTLEDLLWVCLEVGKEKLYVGGIYLVPNTSSRANKVQDQIAELEQDLALYRMDGRVLLAGDWNCKIGEIASDVGDRLWTRQSVSDTSDTRGKHIMDMMNAASMVVLNGIRGTVAQNTFHEWHTAGESRQGINDYIAVSADMIGITSDLENRYDLRDLFETDHCGLTCTIHLIWYQIILKDQAGREQQQRKENFRDVSRIVDPQFWKGLREGAESELENTLLEMERYREDVGQSWSLLKNGVLSVLREGKRRAKARKRGKVNGQTEEDMIRAQLSVLRTEKKAAAREQTGGEQTERYRQAVRQMSRLRKQLQKQWWKEKMKDIEQCTRERNTQEYWNKIKELAGWRKGGNKKLPEALIDAEGTEKAGTDRLKVAADTFRKLGEDDQNDPDFDFEFAERVRKQVEQLEEEEMTEEEEKVNEGELEQRGKLGREISQKEVNKAIDKLKNGKAAGQDAIIAEVLKWAGESMRHVVWKMCCVAWRTEEVPHEWMQGLVFPLYKDGDDRDLLNYRGITLLSIVAKVYCSVLTDRLTLFAEREEGIVEEQGGFRPRRGTDDQLFVLTETIRIRTGKVRKLMTQSGELVCGKGCGRKE